VDVYTATSSIYQNEITIESGLSEEEDNWLSNFGDNPLVYIAIFPFLLASDKSGCIMVFDRRS
jgi:hypothetical protein